MTRPDPTNCRERPGKHDKASRVSSLLTWGEHDTRTPMHDAAADLLQCLLHAGCTANMHPASVVGTLQPWNSTDTLTCRGSSGLNRGGEACPGCIYLGVLPYGGLRTDISRPSTTDECRSWGLHGQFLPVRGSMVRSPSSERVLRWLTLSSPFLTVEPPDYPFEGCTRQGFFG